MVFSGGTLVSVVTDRVKTRGGTIKKLTANQLPIEKRYIRILQSCMGETGKFYRD